MNTNKQQHLPKPVEIHRANLLKNLEHRLQVAIAKGDERLVRQLEAEKRYYDR